MADTNKKIIFTVKERTKVDFKLQLQYDGMTQVKFFNAILDGYIGKDPDLHNYLSNFKKEKKIQSGEQRRRIKDNIKNAKKVENKFALADDEVENIFDILEQEHPDL